ncbi:homoserine O-succinyltransferase [Candidatus Pantoea edessiphila]|uniref:Homoserine O-succinyltransferase n=1 Tax=Candidatus Pantoea edessiphila TaxID=2044610 RepID=A0A2P5SYB1_9GAMM|nr:homoserine O-succinyltransferase [Candidatus Pantoea edessiphila]MBK4775881.1 homoserine O-succinyltransferase [Pantoea sp. Edef]PPI87315.1 homoserine O-succinyltransferase [Candidatus Pantoea edessiphila]
MPIRVPIDLPAVKLLRKENFFAMTSSIASIQKIRPLKLLILNLMPKKIETENQLLRLLANYPLQIDIQLLRVNSHKSRNTSSEHLKNFYCELDNIYNDNFDGLIVTGAPLGLIDFSDVSYWSQIKKIFFWAKNHVTSTLFICWAAQAALNIIYGIPKKIRSNKLFGVFDHKILKSSLLTRGFDNNFLVPHSRYADFSIQLIKNHTDLELHAVLEFSSDAYIMSSRDKRLVFVTGHPEYDLLTLSQEYQRDIKLGRSPEIPYNYFPKDNPSLLPNMSWCSHGHLFFSNWLNYYVYQITPLNILYMQSI